MALKRATPTRYSTRLDIGSRLYDDPPLKICENADKRRSYVARLAEDCVLVGQSFCADVRVETTFSTKCDNI